MYKLQPIRRRKRKTGRNESCPCGRTKEVEIKLNEMQIKSYMAYRDSGESIEKVMAKIPIKYKHCCGKIENQRMMAAVRRHISQTIYSAVHSKKVSRLRRALDLFKKN